MAIALWKLATGNSYRSIGKKFVVAKSTAVEITTEFCKCITEMAPDFIVFPKTERETAEAIIRFAEFSNCKTPQVVGAIDRSNHWRCSVKKVFLEISQNLQENTCARDSF